MIIPEVEAIKTSCRVNTGPAQGKIPVLFEPEATAPWPSGLEVVESLLTVDRRKPSQVNIKVVNTSSHGITIINRFLSQLMDD